MLQARNRLRHSADIQAVRRQGRGVKHALGTLVFRPNSLSHSRFCFSASKRVGNAIRRNRAKRLMREAVRLNLSHIADGWDVVLIPRSKAVSATYVEIEEAILTMLQRARLLQEQDV